MVIKFKRLRDNLKIPEYAHPGDAGLDLFSLEDYLLQPGERHSFALGFALELPEGYVSLIWDKSGLAQKHGITLIGGVIEYTYRGEYQLIMLNIGDLPFEVHKGDKIGQLLIQPIVTAQIVEVEQLSETARGQGGFGSTGKE
ncbi:MAG: dUTP diphosphatase [bacterium]